MRRRQVIIGGITMVAALGVGAEVAVAASGPPFELAVKLDKTLGATPGTLTFRADAVEFAQAKQIERQAWRYEDIRQIQVRSARRIDLLTYEDQGKLKFGADRRYEFALSAGEVPLDLLTFLLARVERPLLLAVIPPAAGNPALQIAVKHERQGKGSEGMLALYDGALAYDTKREGEARYWRFADLDNVLPLDRYRLQVTAREDGGLRPFVFQLKTGLPDGFYDTLWAQVNARSW